MPDAITRAGRDPDAGFSLIELMVVVLTIAILVGLAIPTFLGARTRAQDRAAQTRIRDAFTAERTIYTERRGYVSAAADTDGDGTTDLEGVEPSLDYVATNPPTVVGPVTVVLDAGTTPPTLYVAARSGSGSCFYLRDSGSSATQFATDADGSCGGAALQVYSLNGW